MSRFARRLSRVRPASLAGGLLSASATDLGNGSVQFDWITSLNPGGGWTVGRNGIDSTGDGPWSTTVAGTARSQTFMLLVTGSTYTFTVTDGTHSATAQVTIGAVSGNVISNFTATATSGTSIHLAWSYSGATLSNYTLTRGGVTIATVAAGQTSYDDGGLTAGTSYSYALVGNVQGGGTTNAVSVSRSTTGGGGALFVAGVTTKIMPLGDSITQGTGSSSGAGYRPLLWAQATEWQTESVGDLDDAAQGNSYYDATHRWHSGHYGWLIEQVDAQIATWLASTTPKVIMMQLGTNNLLFQDPSLAPGKLTTLIDHIFTILPNVHLFVAAVTPSNPYRQAFVDFNAALPSIVSTRQAQGKNIYFVDMYNALNPSTDLSDEVHPNNAGYQKMANTWKAALAAANSAAPSSTFPLAVSANNRYLVTQSGSPYFVTADTAWSLMCKLSLVDIKRYIDMRAAQGFNTIMTNVTFFGRGTSGPRGTAYVGNNVTQWNQSFFDGIKEAIQYAGTKNMQIMLNPLWMANNGGWDSFENVGMPSAGNMSTYGTMLGNFFSDTPNMMWFVGGDEQADVAWSAIKPLADALEAADPGRLKTYHPRWDSYSTTSGESWLNFNSYQLNDNVSNMLYATTATGYALSPTRPIFCIEPPYDPTTAMGGVDTTALMNRQNNWGSALAGAIGVSYGGPRTVWYIGGDNGGSIVDADVNRPAPPMIATIGTIMSQYSWHKLVPDNSVITSGLSSGRDRATAGVASDGTLIAVYVPSQRSITLNMARLSASATAQWYLPSTGLTSGGAIAVTNSGTRSFTSPGSEDGVLFIKV